MRGVLHRIRRTMLAGMLVLLPPLITILLISLVLGWFGSLFDRPVLRAAVRAIIGNRFIPENPIVILALKLCVVLGILYLAGLLATNFIGRKIISAFDQIVLRIPLVKGIYGSAKQLLETFHRPGSARFQQVVLVEYPRKGIWVIGFLTDETFEDLNKAAGAALFNIFVPTTPNPTSGFLLLVPKDEVVLLDLSIEEAVKFVVSGGLVQPELVRPAAEKNRKALRE